MNPLIKGKENSIFVPQFQSADQVELMIREQNKYDHSLPEWNWCGMCCLQMVLGSKGIEKSLPQLYEQAFEQGVYKEVDGRIIGAYHQELARFIGGNDWGLYAQSIRFINSQYLLREFLDNGFVLIASVTPEIRYAPTLPSNHGGHLVLVYGYEIKPDGVYFIFHNSTGFASTDTQIAVSLRADVFFNYFSRKGILIYSYE